MNEAATTDGLQGSWKVRRVSGLLPPGVTKEIQGDRGRTLLFGLHFGSFRIDGPRFVYLFWPIVDVLEPIRARSAGRGAGDDLRPDVLPVPARAMTL